MNAVLLRAELRRVARNRRTLIFTAILPVVFFLSFSAGADRGRLGGLAVAPYVMVSMATYGAMNALFTAGGLIAGERAIGWNRQLRVAGLRPATYIVTKAVVAYLTAVPGVVAVFVLSSAFRHVDLGAGQWVGSAVWILAGLAPVAALGVAVGYAARPQSLQQIFGIGSALLALLGGLWVPAENFPHGLRLVMEALPTYWSAKAGRSALLHTWVGWQGAAMILGWTLALSALAAWAYRRDALRPASAGTT
jgi:ABC-2 type transport system permease protein